MHPIFHPRFFASDSFTLRNLVCMMHRNVVYATAVDVKLFAEVFHGHCGALYMPAGKAHVVESVPFHLATRSSRLLVATLAPFPQCKVVLVSFLTKFNA